MYTVLVKIAAAGFAFRMAMMRGWLNGHGCEPIRFAYDTSNDDVFDIRLDFSQGEDAEAFEKCFGAERRNVSGKEEATTSEILNSADLIGTAACGGRIVVSHLADRLNDFRPSRWRRFVFSSSCSAAYSAHL